MTTRHVQLAAVTWQNSRQWGLVAGGELNGYIIRWGHLPLQVQEQFTVRVDANTKRDTKAFDGVVKMAMTMGTFPWTKGHDYEHQSVDHSATPNR